MRLNVLTIAFNSMPWIGSIFAELMRFDGDWRWTIVEGASMPNKDTRWMNSQKSGVSTDGTHQFIMGLALHPNITVLSKPSWEGKTEQVNAGVATFDKDGILLQCDSDELWTAEQMENLVLIFSQHLDVNTVKVAMDYMLGPNIVATSKDGYGNRRDEWVRAWRFKVGMWMDCHEPPVFSGNHGRMMPKEESEKTLGRILHMAWVSPAQVAFKQMLYGKGYSNATSDWMRLQTNTKWPVSDLKGFLPWTGEGGTADKLLSKSVGSKTTAFRPS